MLTRGTLDSVREAEALLRECLEICLKTIPDEWGVPNTRSLPGQAVLGIADLDAALPAEARADHLRRAEPLILDGYAALKDNPATPASAQTGGFDRPREALERVVRLCEVWERIELGKGYGAKAAERKARPDAAPPAPDKK